MTCTVLGSQLDVNVNSLCVAARLLHKGRGSSRSASPCFVFYLQITIFLSGAEGGRTPDLRRAKAALSRLSYGPVSIER
jgi:hypothetical protein